MKKLLIAGFALVCSWSHLNAQTYISEDFESADTGFYSVPAGWFGGPTDSSELLISEITPTPYGKSLLFNRTSDTYFPIATQLDWASRASGNNTLMLNMDFYTGTKTSQSIVKVNYTEDGTYNSLMSVSFVPSYGGFSFYTQTTNTNLTLLDNTTENTWYHFNMAYAADSGKIIVQCNGIELLNISVPGGKEPIQFIVTSTMTGTNALDNLELEALPTLTLGLDEPHSNYRVYPNPSSSTVTIAAAKPISEMRLYDLYGKLAMRSDNGSEMDLTTLSSGTYLLKVIFGDGSVSSQKLIRE